MSVFSSFNAQRPIPIWEGIQARAINGQRLTVALVDLAPNTVVQEHRHGNEQLGFIVQGELTFTIGGETRTLRAGETYAIPPDVPHSAVTGAQGCVALDTFAPGRADWEALDQLEPSPSAWNSGG